MKPYSTHEVLEILFGAFGSSIEKVLIQRRDIVKSGGTPKEVILPKLEIMGMPIKFDEKNKTTEVQVK